MGCVPEAELPEDSDVTDQGAASGDHEHNRLAGRADADGSNAPEETADERAVAREDGTTEFGEGNVLTGTPAPAAEVAEPSEDDTTTSQQVTEEGWLQRTATKLPQYRRLVWYRENRRALEDSSFWRDRDPSENAPGRLPDDGLRYLRSGSLSCTHLRRSAGFSMASTASAGSSAGTTTKASSSG